MRQAIVSVQDEEYPGIEAVISMFRDAELLDVEALSCDWTGGVVRVRVGERLDEHRLDETDGVEWWEEASQSESEHVYLLEVTDTERSTVTTSTDEVLPVNYIEASEAGFTFDISGSQEGIRDLIAGFEDANVGLTLQELRDYRGHVNPLAPLTERQREVLEEAYDSGYYDVPRNASTAEVAANLGVDGSTVAEHLQRAERNLLAQLLGH